MKKILCIALAACLTGLTLGCSHRSGSTGYAANQVMNVEYGTVRELRRVNMRGYSNGVGAVTGAVVGAVTGSAVSGRWDKGLGAMLGIMVGGLVGSAAQQNMTAADGYELVIQLDSGRTVAIAVPAADGQFNIGQRVKLMENARGSQVMPTNDGYQAPVNYPRYDNYRR
jgi:outer membrane lipoprotein SlyB